MTLAPIALFVYNRLETLKQAVEALKNNLLANESELFIYADGAKTQNDEKVSAVKEYIRTIDGFKNIEIRESLTNKGLANSVIAGVTEIIERYGKIIVLEDDLITSPNFLKYMNESLDMYEHDEEVACIAGYNYPIVPCIKEKTFFLRGADCWGWATWKRGWELFEKDAQKLKQEILDKNLQKEFDFNYNYQYLKMLDNKNSWAIRWYASTFINDKLCLYPTKSLVQNIGFGEDATHCLGSGEQLGDKVDLQTSMYEKIQIKENKKMRRAFEKYLKKLTQNKNNFFITRIKDGDRRIVKLFGFIKIKYNKKKKVKYGFSGDYKNWGEVEKLCDGYSSANILEKTLESTLKVKNGESVFERDSFIFEKVQYSWGLLACLFKVAAENNNKLNVIDFGGALGSHYFQNKEFLKPLQIKSWTVVEQEHYVKAGKEKIADGILKFADSIDEIDGANVLILSSVLQYLPNPYQWLEKIIDKGVDYIIIDRTAISLENRDRLTLQVVPPEIYEAKYPAWFLDEKKLLSYFDSKYRLISDFDVTFDKVVEIPSYFKGYFFKKIKE